MSDAHLFREELVKYKFVFVLALGAAVITTSQICKHLRRMRTANSLSEMLDKVGRAPYTKVNEDFMRALNERPEVLFAGQAAVPLVMPEMRRQVAEAVLHDQSATMAERTAAALILGYDSVDEALGSEAHNAAKSQE